MSTSATSKNVFFPEYGNDYLFSKFEEKILEFWKREKTFEKTLKISSGKPTYFFYDGPPFATGLPHYGHILAGTIKDIVPRYWTMRGYSVPRRFGWDTHGLPIEFEMEKTLQLNGSIAIQEYGVAKFNEACRGIVLRYASEWRKTVERMGRWIDMDHDYKTMDPNFMESVWWVFKKLWDQGLIYEGKKVVPYSWRLTAPLSNFEASLNYKDVQDPAVTVLFPLKSAAKVSGAEKWISNTAFAVWTTTPWTLPANVAIAAQGDEAKVTYARYLLKTPVGQITHVIMAKNLAEKYELSEATDEFSGQSLKDVTYEPLLTCFVDNQRKTENAFRVLIAEYVSSEDGTGLVHQAPAFGEDDYATCLKAGISLVDPTDMQANFTDAVKMDPRLAPIVGVFVKDADKHIIKVLKDGHRLLKHDTLQHSYPFCERSDTPLIYKAISSWFVKVEAIKEKMLKNNQQITWVPSHIKDGRFGKWLENARDWCISRNRFWGTPLPVWICSKCKHKEVLGSRADLDKLAGRHVEDLHMHFIDSIVTDCPKCQGSKTLKRTSEVLDCWFESGSMPYAQGHYPFEDKEVFEKSFPADFIGEGLDQTRGWFYTLTVLSTALFDKPAFKNCIVNGIVLAEDGRKMSKRLKNYPDPNELLNKYGADALRLYLMQSPAMHAEELRFSEKGLVELMRAVMIPLWNAYSFFASYANIDQWTNAKNKNAPEKLEVLDRWILARVQEMESEIHSHMKDYRLADVAPTLVSFIDDLTNWYIRLNRERFWSENNSENSDTKNAAYSTLWKSLATFAKVLAPFLPFYSEVLTMALAGVSIDKNETHSRSVHEFEFDQEGLAAPSRENRLLLEEVSLAKSVILLGRALRGEAKIGLRQPLSRVKVAGLSNQQQEILRPMFDLIRSELNVKEIEVVAKAADLVEESIKPNHRVMGKKVGAAMKDIQAALGQWGSVEIAEFEINKSVTLNGFVLGMEDLQIVRKAKEGKLAQSGFGLVAELDPTLNEALICEGLAREVINRIQQLRKERKYHLADRIEIIWNSEANSLVEKVLQSPNYVQLIQKETLGVSLSRVRENFSASIDESFEKHGTLKLEIKNMKGL